MYLRKRLSEDFSDLRKVYQVETKTYVIMASKPLQFVVVERKLNVGKNAGKVMQIARLIEIGRASCRERV